MTKEGDLCGAAPPDRLELPQISSRMSFIYLEKCKITREDSALKAEDRDGYVLIPSHAFLVVILGPGVSITHRAIELLSNSGTAVVWAGEAGLKYFGYGRSLARSASLLIQQAKIVSTPKLHMMAVKRMYSLRFPEEDLTGQTLQQLRGKEGSRMKREYARHAKKWNVEWSGRRYDPHDFSSSDPVNRALSIANTCLYGIAFAVISGLGLSPGLGIIHTGLEASFVYDVADLYKAELTIPLCFELAATCPESIDKVTRKQLRDRIHGSTLVARMVKDILYIMDVDQEEDCESLMLWDGNRGNVQAGIQHKKRGD